MAIAPGCEDSTSNSEGIGPLLTAGPQNLLDFYLDHSTNSLERLKDGLRSFWKDPLHQLPLLKRQTDEVAFDLCSLCPGTDLLRNQDLETLYHHCSFVSLWLNLAYLTAKEGVSHEQLENGRSLKEQTLLHFLQTSHSSLTSELIRLRLDPVELAGLKAICIWKMGMMDQTTTAKVLSGEHYLAVAKALNAHHQTSAMLDFEKAARLADITALLAPISAVYQDLQMVYNTLNIEDCYKGDF